MQPLELTSAKPQPLRRQPDRQHSVDHGLHRLDPIDLLHAHRDRRRRSRRHSQPSTWAGSLCDISIGGKCDITTGGLHLQPLQCILCKPKRGAEALARSLVAESLSGDSRSARPIRPAPGLGPVRSLHELATAAPPGSRARRKRVPRTHRAGVLRASGDRRGRRLALHRAAVARSTPVTRSACTTRQRAATCGRTSREPRSRASKWTNRCRVRLRPLRMRHRPGLPKRNCLRTHPIDDDRAPRSASSTHCWRNTARVLWVDRRTFTRGSTRSPSTRSASSA